MFELEPVCNIDLSKSWTMPVEAYSHDSRFENYRPYEPEHHKYSSIQLVHPSNNRDFYFEVVSTFISDTAQTNDAYIDEHTSTSKEPELFKRTAYNGFSIHWKGYMNEYCNWQGTTTKDSTLTLTASNKVCRDFRIVISIELNSVERGDGEKAYEYMKEIIEGINVKDYAYWDTKNHYPYTREYLDSLYVETELKKYDYYEKTFRGILNCTGRRGLFHENNLDFTDSLNRLNDDDLIARFTGYKTALVMSNFKEYYERLYNLQYSYKSYYDLARKVVDKSQSMEDIFTAWHNPLPENELCKYLAYDDSMFFKKKMNIKKINPSHKILTSFIRQSYESNFPQFLYEFGADIRQIFSLNDHIKSSPYTYPKQINNPDESKDTVTYYYWTRLDTLPLYTIFEIKRKHHSWGKKNIPLPFVVNDTIDDSKRGNKLHLRSEEYIACFSDNQDSVFFFSTKDPNHSWHSFNMTPPLDERFIMIWRAYPMSEKYESYGFRKIQHYNHIADKLQIKDDFHASLINHEKSIHMQDSTRIRIYKNDNSFFQINDTTFIAWSEYASSFEDYLHPALHLYVSGIFTGNLDGNDGDEIFYVTASNGKIENIVCYSFQNGKMIKLNSDQITVAALSSSKVNDFLTLTRSGNYEMPGWSEISKHDNKQSQLLWILTGAIILTGSFLFVRRKKYTLN